jgi:CheY-like chemotaxis protein
MLGMNSVKASKKLRAHYIVGVLPGYCRGKIQDKTRAILNIAHTATTLRAAVARGKAAGFEDYIIKPIKVPEVLQVINRHMN